MMIHLLHFPYWITMDGTRLHQFVSCQYTMHYMYLRMCNDMKFAVEFYALALNCTPWKKKVILSPPPPPPHETMDKVNWRCHSKKFSVSNERKWVIYPLHKRPWNTSFLPVSTTIAMWLEDKFFGWQSDVKVDLRFTAPQPWPWWSGPVQQVLKRSRRWSFPKSKEKELGVATVFFRSHSPFLSPLT